MKKVFFFIIAFIGILSFANVNTGTGTATPPPADTLTVFKVVKSTSTVGKRPTKNSFLITGDTLNYRLSDSSKYAEALKTGFLGAFEPKQWAR